MTAPANPFGSSPLVSIGADPRGTASDDVDLGSFWPKINVQKFRDAMRIDGSVTEVRARLALIEAGLSVNDELVDWRLTQLEQGHATLADTPGAKADNVSGNVHRWLRAVHCLAAASLAERYRSMDMTTGGAQRADEAENPIDGLRRDAAWAIADIMKKSRTVIELI